MGLYGGIGAFTDPTTAASDKGISSRASRVTHAPSYTHRPNSGKTCRTKHRSTAEILPHSKALSKALSSSLLCGQVCHPSIAPCWVLPISAPGHLLVHQPVSELWCYSGSAYHTVSGMATTVVGPTQTQKNAHSPLDDQPQWQKSQLHRETGDESSLVHD